MHGEGRGYGAPDRMGDWGEIEETGEINPTREAQNKPLNEKLKTPTVRKVLNIALAIATTGAVGYGLYKGYEVAQHNVAEAAQEVGDKTFERQKTDLTENLAKEGATEEEINEVLGDPELRQILEEITAEKPKDLTEFLEEKGYIEKE